MAATYIINLYTKRKIKLSGKTHKTLISEKLLDEREIQPSYVSGI